MSGSRERWVGWASAACAVHCLAGPALALYLPVLAIGERIEAVVLWVLLLGAGWLLWRGYRGHGRLLPCAPGLAGLAVWALALGVSLEGLAHAAMVGAGGMLTFAGLQWSARARHTCGCGACATAREDGSPADVRPA